MGVDNLQSYYSLQIELGYHVKQIVDRADQLQSFEESLMQALVVCPKPHPVMSLVYSQCTQATRWPPKKNAARISEVVDADADTVEVASEKQQHVFFAGLADPGDR